MQKSNQSNLLHTLIYTFMLESIEFLTINLKSIGFLLSSREDKQKRLKIADTFRIRMEKTSDTQRVS